MNKIVIDKNKIGTYDDSCVCVNEGSITFKKNGDYTLEYVNSDKIQLDVVVMDQVSVKLFIWSKDNELQVINHYQLGQHSNLILFQFYYNKSIHEETIVDLNGAYSKFSLGFSSISSGEEEYYMVVNHNNHHVSSDISNKCVGMEGSKISFQIDSVLEKGNVDCVMDQNTRILTLGDVEAKIVPNMFIDEDSVTAKHGSVIGSFCEDDIFYLMSRGIEQDEAIILLLKGFIFSNLVVDMEKRAMIFQVIQDLRR